jgi:hypothetical protein
MEERKMKIGTIKFGKARPAPKAVLVDVFYDKETEATLFKIGLDLLKKDKEAVIEYVIQKSLAYQLKK